MTVSVLNICRKLDLFPLNSCSICIFAVKAPQRFAPRIPPWQLFVEHGMYGRFDSAHDCFMALNIFVTYFALRENMNISAARVSINLFFPSSCEK